MKSEMGFDGAKESIDELIEMFDVISGSTLQRICKEAVEKSGIDKIGHKIGVIISLLFSAKVLGLGLSMIGLSHLPTQFNAVTVTVPVVILLVCFFVFAYLASGKIKKLRSGN